MADVRGMMADVLITLEDVASVDLLPDVVQAAVIPIGNDGLGHFLEFLQVVYYDATEEGAAIFQGRFINDNFRAFGFDSLHDTLNGGLAEVVGVRLHGESEYSNDAAMFLAGIIAAAGFIITCLAQHGIGDIVFPRAVALDDGGHHVLRDILVVGQQLLGVLGKAVAAVAEAGVVVVGADTGVESDAGDDGLGVEALHLGVGVELVEIADAQGEVGVGEELDGFGFFHANEKNRDVLFIEWVVGSG